MQFKNPMLVVKDMQTSREFYRTVLGLRTVMDFGENVTLTGGLSLQTLESWRKFVRMEDEAIAFGGNNFELYFEEDAFDEFLHRLEGMEIDYVHPVFEHRWGQRVVRFYDPDRHVIEVGEPMRQVCRRFLVAGMTVEEVARRMDVPVKLVSRYAREGK